MEKRLRSLQALLVRLVRRAKGILKERHLPQIADRVCQIYIDDDQADLQTVCKNILQMRLELNPHQLHHFLHTPIGEALVTGLDTFFRPADGLQSPASLHKSLHPLPSLSSPESSSPESSFSESSSPESSSSESSSSESSSTLHHQHDRQPWQTALVNMASDPDGISLFSVLRHMPKSAHLNSDRVFSTAQHIDRLFRETEQIMAGLKNAVQQEIHQESSSNFSQLPDLRQPGPFSVAGHCFQIQGQGTSTALDNTTLNAHQSWFEQRKDRCLRIWLYHPFPWPIGSIPVVILSHGLASAPDEMLEYAQHLASHGYAIALPQHPGSDIDHMQQMLEGKVSTVFEHTEFIQRPLDISAVLDELERRNQQDYDQRLNLTQVGMVGASFGAYTALVVAGAPLNLNQLATICQSSHTEPNISLLLQCRALDLPQVGYSLRDPRIAAIVTLDAVGSQILNTQEFHQIQSPVMMLAGNQDITTPLASEQLRLFQSFNPRQRYLGIMMGKTHLRNWHKWQTSSQLQLQLFPSPSLPQTMVFDTYIKALTLAFFKTYLEQQPTASTYLKSSYGQYLSQPPFNLLFLKSWTEEDFISSSLDRELGTLGITKPRTSSLYSSASKTCG